MSRLAMKSTMKTTNKIQAICVAAPAKQEKPKIAAMSPITKNVIDQLNIGIPPFLKNCRSCKNSWQLACQTHGVSQSSEIPRFSLLGRSNECAVFRLVLCHLLTMRVRLTRTNSVRCNIRSRKLYECNDPGPSNISYRGVCRTDSRC